MKISIKGYIASKQSELFSDCADRYDINIDNNKFAISDGVSKSFFPKFWAEILVQNFVKSKEIDCNKYIEDCQKEWQSKVTSLVKKQDVKWFTLNAFNNKRPGLATFVGLSFFIQEDKLSWKANALGDSFLFFIPRKSKDFDSDCIKLSSKKDLIFDNFPDYFSSIGESHKGEVQIKDGELKEGTFYLMTDALSEWFINEKENAIGKINVWGNQKDFERFIDEERISTKLSNDDSAILIIKVIDDKKNKISYSEINISKINSLVLEQRKEVEKNKEIELERKKKIEEEKIKKEEEETITEKKEEKEKIVKESKEVSEIQLKELKESTVIQEEIKKIKLEGDKSNVPNKSKNETLKTESQPIEPKDKPPKTLLEKSIEGVKKSVEKISEVLTGKAEESNTETIECITENIKKPVIQKTGSENMLANQVKTTEEKISNPKQEPIQKETEKRIKKNIKKGNIPSKSNITDKF